MFERLDWRDPEPYQAILDNPVYGRIAWEFLRRNPDYQIDVAAYLAEKGEGDMCEDDPGRFTDWCRLCESKWKMVWPQNPKDHATGEEFVSLAHNNPERFKTLGPGGRMAGPLVLVPADLEMPLKDLEAQVLGIVRRLRNDGIKQGVVKPRTSRALAPRLYVEYLRILDAFSAGATAREVGELLAPNAANDPEYRQRDKRIKAAHVAALKMQEGGYRVLI